MEERKGLTEEQRKFLSVGLEDTLCEYVYNEDFDNYAKREDLIEVCVKEMMKLIEYTVKVK